MRGPDPKPLSRAPPRPHNTIFRGFHYLPSQHFRDAEPLLTRDSHKRHLHSTYGVRRVAICVDLELWEAWTAAGGSTKKVEELSKVIKPQADPKMIHITRNLIIPTGRLLRLLGAIGIIKEVGEDIYTSTPFSLALGDRESIMADNIQCRTHHWQNGYKNPEDAKYSNYADWCPEKHNFFDKCIAFPECQESFSGFMRTLTMYKLPWTEFYDTKFLVEGVDLKHGGVLCVDIGGHHGADL
ncbi:hypothetical protein F4809DRAFT_646368 [Biscogniauxia mediterranea]|nr:hypothetical protein F4809DRAFT_646368 [Biscogniauxia mediterranea]